MSAAAHPNRTCRDCGRPADFAVLDEQGTMHGWLCDGCDRKDLAGTAARETQDFLLELPAVRAVLQTDVTAAYARLAWGSRNCCHLTARATEDCVMSPLMPVIR